MKRAQIALVTVAVAAAAVGTTAAAVASTPAESAASAHSPWHGKHGHGWGNRSRVSVQVITPRPYDRAGVDGKAWIVDLKLRYPTTAAAGFTSPQLTGPAAHANTAPFPGSFSTGPDDHLPGLVVLDSNTTSSVTGFSGPGTNLANLFNVTSITNQTKHYVQIEDTWIVGAPIAGQDVNTTLTVGVVRDLNHDGVYNDAPAVVPDANHNGRVDAQDLRDYGVVGRVHTVRFHINGSSS